MSVIHLFVIFRTYSSVWYWCLGTCLLPAVQECPPRLCQCHVECCQLGQCVKKIAWCQNGKLS